MRIALRLVLMLLIVLVVLFAGQAFETRRLASAHELQIADLRQRGIMGPTNPWATDTSREAQAWVKILDLLSDDAAIIGELGFELRSEWPDLPAAPAALILKRVRALEGQLSEIPEGVSHVRVSQRQVQTTSTRMYSASSVRLALMSGSAGAVDLEREVVLGNLLAFAAQYALKEPDGTRTAARRMGAVLELLEELDSGSLALGERRLEVERIWLAHLATLRRHPELDHVLFFEHLDPILASVGTLERARRGLGRMVERRLGPGHAAWNEAPPAMAIFERGGRLDDARMLLDQLEANLEILNTPAKLTSPRLPGPRSTPSGLRRPDDFSLAQRCEFDLAAARELDLARVVLALDAHRQETGAWPTRLSELTRWFPAGIPTDPRTDAPFDYVLAGTTARVQVAGFTSSARSSRATVIATGTGTATGIATGTGGVIATVTVTATATGTGTATGTAIGPRLRWDLEGEE